MKVRVRIGLIGLWAALGVTFPVTLRAEIGDLAADEVIGESSLFDSAGLAFGPGTFAKPHGIAVDRSVTPNHVYVSDTEHHRVLGWADADALANGAPADLVIGQADMTAFGCNRQAFDGGITPPATLSSLCQPTGLAVDDGGRLYVADAGNCRVLVFDDPFGTDQVADHVLGTTGQCSGVTVNATDLYDPEGVAVDPAGNVFVADTLHCRVLEFDGPIGTTDAQADRVYGQTSFTTSSCQSVYFPRSVAVDPSGTLWVGSDSRVYQFDGALGGSADAPTRSLGSLNCNDGGESASSTCGPAAVAVDAAGRLYLGDAGNSRILAFDAPHGIFQAARVYGQPSFLGSTTLFQDACNTGGPSATSLCLRKFIPLVEGGSYDEAAAVAIDAGGRLYVADGLNHRVLRYDTPLTSSVATVVLGHEAMDDVRMPTVVLGEPGVLAYDPRAAVVAVDGENSRLLVYANPSGTGTPVGVIGQPDLATTGCNTGGVSQATLCRPSIAAADEVGNLWVADSGNNRVLEFDYPWVDYDSQAKRWVVASGATRVFGQPDFATTACSSGPAGLCDPRGLAFAPPMTVFVSDRGNNRVVYHQNPFADATADLVLGQATFAGTACNAGGRGPATLCDPHGIAYAAAADRLFVADTGNHRVLALDPAGVAPPVLFGQANAASAACGAGAGGLCRPQGVDLDRRGNLYVADTANDRLLEFDAPLASDALADRVFGQSTFDDVGCKGASPESLCAPTAVSLSSSYDHIWVADGGNRRIVRYDAPFCIDEFVLNPITRHTRGIHSTPKSTKLVIRFGSAPATPDDTLSFSGKLVLLEQDGFIDPGDGPLVTLTSASGEKFRDRIPHLSNERATANGGVWTISDYGPLERDFGVVEYDLKERFVIPGSDTRPQYDKLGYKGRAVGADFSTFTEMTATYRMQFQSICMTTEIVCRTSGSGRVCKAAR